jgi:hypothetical protein
MNFSVQKGVVYKGQRLLVPADPTLKTRILQHYHDHPLAGHIGSEKTIELVKRDLYWPKMDEEIKLYVTTCHSCQKHKSSHQLPIGLLKPLEIPMQQWSHVSMDFIGPLPTSQGYNAIAVVVDKLTKLVHLIATNTTVTAKEFALIFFNNIVRLHGVPNVIISDRDSKFTSVFWKELMKSLNIQQRMSSAFHPESDGQTERSNRTLETMLRHYVNERNDDWSQQLTAAEIAINNSQQSSTKYSPFYMNYGFNPRFPFLVQGTVKATVPTTVPAAEEVFETIKRTTQQAIQNMQKAQQQQSLYANRKRREDKFQVGEQVYLSTQNLNITSGVSKLNPKYIGPFPISRIINPVAIQLALPAHFKIHNSFHVSRIKRAKVTEDFPDRLTIEKPPPIIQADSDQESEWEIERIIDRRRSRGRIEYLVKWKGYDSYDNQWLTVSQLANARDAVREFEESLRDTRLNATETTVSDASTVSKTGQPSASTLYQRQVVNQHHQKQVARSEPQSRRVGGSVQCSARTNKGRGCRKRTLRSEMCQIHLQREHNLRIKQSTLPGAKLGVFTGSKPIPRNQMILPYTGQFSAVQPNSDYALKITNNHFVNANRYTDTAGFINDCRRKNQRSHQCPGNNCQFSVNRTKKECVVRTTKTIPPNTEVFIPYGAAYWKNFDKSKLTQPQPKQTISQDVRVDRLKQE